MAIRLGIASGLTVTLLAMAGGAAAQSNTATGYQALDSVTTGTNNTAMGYRALTDLTSGSNNAAFGYAALINASVGTENSAFGRGALYTSTTASGNTAVGMSALYSTTTGYYNTAVGASAMLSNTTGRWNAALGTGALQSMATGEANVAIGYAALNFSDDVNYTVAIGAYALQSATGVDSQVAVGPSALYSCTSCTANTALGAGAGVLITNGGRNVAVGDSALGSLATGWNNTAVGYGAGPTNTGYDNTGAFGYGAIPTASNRIRIGNDLITQIGGKVAWSNLSDARFKTKVKEDVPGLSFVTKLRPVSYYWDEQKLQKFNGTEPPAKGPEPKKYTGFIAQEVEAAAKQTDFDFSGVVAPPNDQTPYQLSYAEFVVPLVKAVQEQQKEIEELRAAGQGFGASGIPWLMLLTGVLGGALGSLLLRVGVERARRLAPPRVLRDVTAP